jgi:ketosteroid isomerase-like protein
LGGEKRSGDVSAEVERGIRRAFRPEFRIEGLLGRGGMSLVYLAHEVELNRFVALKVLPLQLTIGTDVAERFKREARIAASLDHPHIVPIHQIGSRSTFLWFTMKFVKGQSLVELLADRGPLELEECLALVEQVASALHYAHDRGVVHRDVKPANVMIDEKGWALVCDFGVAKAFGAVALTQTGGTMGTPSHMSPEQLYGQPLSGRSDQYSLAIMAYELLAGKPPFAGASLGEVLRQHLLEPPPRLSDVRPEIPGYVSDVLIRAMSKKPEERFKSVLDFVVALGGRRLEGPREEGGRSDLEVGGRFGLLETTAPISTWRFGRRSRLRPGHLPLVAAFGGLLFAALVGLASLGAPMPRDSLAQTPALVGLDGRLLDPIAQSDPLIGAPTAAANDSSRAGLTATALGAGASRGDASSVETLSKVVEENRAEARVEIRRVVQNLERSIESRDVSRFRAVHRNLTDKDQSAWEGFFQSLRTLDVTFTIRGLDVVGNSANATLATSFEYQRKDGSAGQHADELRVTFEKIRSGWRVTAIKNQ